MQPIRSTVGKYVCGMAACLIIFLAGGWLILAPFALGYQPYGADWVSQTTNDFATGIPVAAVALIGFFLFLGSALNSLRASGLIVAGPQARFSGGISSQAPVTPVPDLEMQQSDLDRTLSTLAAALAADLAARRQASSNQQTGQSIDHMMQRRDV
ncbi:MAG TPA: hypothetical protein VKV19_19905 [Ktedonobacteraceae bacterium]|nr:hypothetical protein [Ktedonobacteraceae bacterium]